MNRIDFDTAQTNRVAAIPVKAPELAAAATGAGLVLRRVDLGLARTKADLLGALATGLDLPAHFGRNWDALADCLMDRDWMPEQGLVVLVEHSRAWRRQHAADWSMLTEVFGEAAEFWRGKGLRFSAFWD